MQVKVKKLRLPTGREREKVNSIPDSTNLNLEVVKSFDLLQGLSRVTFYLRVEFPNI
jgi:hypothetical protein